MLFTAKEIGMCVAHYLKASHCFNYRVAVPTGCLCFPNHEKSITEMTLDRTRLRKLWSLATATINYE
jgi:hypothetical protein